MVNNLHSALEKLLNIGDMDRDLPIWILEPELAEKRELSATKLFESGRKTALIVGRGIRPHELSTMPIGPVPICRIPKNFQKCSIFIQDLNPLLRKLDDK